MASRTGRDRLRALALIGVFLGAITQTIADEYPSRIVKIIVPIAAGGPVDTVARAVAASLAAGLKQTFVVENRLGAGGNLGIVAGINSPADGYTLLMALGSMLTINPSLHTQAPFDPETQLRPISTLTESTQMLVVHPSFPARSLAEFVATAKQKPPTYGTSGYGTPSYLTMEYLRRLAGFDATPATYRGISQLVTDLIDGQINVGFVATAGVINHVKQGRLRALGISSAKRSHLAPEVPAIAEAGYPGFDFNSYILAPAGTPDAVAAILEREVRNAVGEPEFVKRFSAQDIEAVGSTGAKAKARTVRRPSDGLNSSRP